jgi:hypothetical protein
LVRVGSGVFVALSGVAVAVGIETGVMVAAGSGAKSRSAAVCPAIATTNAKKVNANAVINHCQPVIIRARRVL